jgi:hypothetical protein
MTTKASHLQPANDTLILAYKVHKLVVVELVLLLQVTKQPSE